jgi:uncharacterized protein
MQKILITGGSGLLGQRITALLTKKGYEVAWLSRRKNAQQKSFVWNVEKGELDEESIQWADGIIHLAGEGVADKRWTASRKKAILESRTQSTLLLKNAIETSEKKPQFFISASAIGYYGMNTDDELQSEESSVGNDFLAEVVKAWENEIHKISMMDVRTVILRVGIVLSNQGGALKEITKPPVLAPLGTGQQWMSWIQIEDLARMFLFAIENQQVSGTFNAVSPKPATNEELSKKAAQKVQKPFIGLGVPAFALKLVLGEMAQMVIGGNKVSSAKIQQEGFQFRYSDLDEALSKTFNAS